MSKKDVMLIMDENELSKENLVTTIEGLLNRSKNSITPNELDSIGKIFEISSFGEYVLIRAIKNYDINLEEKYNFSPFQVIIQCVTMDLSEEVIMKIVSDFKLDTFFNTLDIYELKIILKHFSNSDFKKVILKYLFKTVNYKSPLSDILKYLFLEEENIVLDSKIHLSLLEFVGENYKTIGRREFNDIIKIKNLPNDLKSVVIDLAIYTINLENSTINEDELKYISELSKYTQSIEFISMLESKFSEVEKSDCTSMSVHLATLHNSPKEYIDFFIHHVDCLTWILNDISGEIKCIKHYYKLDIDLTMIFCYMYTKISVIHSSYLYILYNTKISDDECIYSLKTLVMLTSNNKEDLKSFYRYLGLTFWDFYSRFKSRKNKKDFLGIFKQIKRKLNTK